MPALTSRDLDVSLRAYALPWADVSTPLPERITGSNIDAVRTATGLTWDPHLEPQYRRERLAGLPGAGVGFTEVPDYRYVTRGEGGPILDSANASYHLFSNGSLFDVAEAVGIAGVALGRDVTFVAGGEIHGGRQVFLIADLGVVELPGDPSPHVRYCVLLSSHNGTAALKVIGTSTRWRCTNQIRAGEIEARHRGAAFSFRHTSRLARRVEDSKNAITAALYQHEFIEQTGRDLLATRMRPAAVSAFIGQYALARVIAKSDAKDPDHPHRSTAVAFADSEIRAILASPTCDGIRDTAYGALAATLEFCDHRRRNSGPDALFTRTMVTAERGKQLAVKVLRDML